MYLQIENEFRQKSRFLKQNLILILCSVALVTVLIAVYNIAEEKNRIAVVIVGFFIGLFLMWITFYAIIYFKHVNKEKKSFCAFFRFSTTLHTYQEKIHNEDIQTLKQILKEHKINTRPKIEEAIKHYQCLLPRKTSQTGQLLSILALVISMLALLVSETVIASAENVGFILEIILTVIIVYAVISLIEKNIFRVFGKDALYTRIEDSLSEIFMTYYFKKDSKSGEEKNG